MKADDDMAVAKHAVETERWFESRQIMRAAVMDSGPLLIFDDEAECFITYDHKGIVLKKKEAPPYVP